MKKHKLFWLLAAVTVISTAQAQTTRFFRISGPTNSAILSFSPDGTLVWSNALTGADYTIQTLSSLNGGNNWEDFVQIPSTPGANTNRIVDFIPPAGMALIPAGVFIMGDITDTNLLGDAALTNVYVSAFYIDTKLVSYSLWQTVYNWATNHGYSFVNTGLGAATNHPAVSMDFYDILKWCNARSQQAGLTPVYYTDTNFTKPYTNGEVNLSNANVNWTANGYRLPTEAEWEKAARGGLSGHRFPWGDTISWSRANYYGDPMSLDVNGYSYDLAPAIGYDPAYVRAAYPFTSPVGSFAPNGYGLYDMSGNVWKWCWDWFGTPYAGGSDPHGPDSGTDRVNRGGGWYSPAFGSRVATRLLCLPITVDMSHGFYCVRAH